MMQPMDIVQETQAKLSGSAEDIPLLTAAISRLKEVDLISDTDQLNLLTAQVMLMGALIKDFTKSNEAVAMIGECTAAVQLLTAWCDPDSALRKAKQIIYELQAAIAKAGTAEEPVAMALQEIVSLPYADNELDGQVLLGAVMQASALAAANAYLQQVDSGKLDDWADGKLLKDLTSHLLKNKFDKPYLLAAFRQASDSESSFAKDAKMQEDVLTIIYGLGLLVKPDAAPAMAAMEQELVQRKGWTVSQFLQPVKAAETVPTIITSGDEIIQEFRVLVEKDGFSEYAMYQGIEKLKAMPTDTDETVTSFFAAMNKLLDAANDYAPPAFREIILLLKKSNEDMASWALEPPEPLTVKDITSMAENSVQDLRQRLASGEPVSLAYTRFMIAYNKMAILLPQGEEAGEAVTSMLKIMMVEGFKALKEYIPADKKELWPQLNQLIEMAGGAGDLANETEIAQLKFFQNFEGQNERLMQLAAALPLPELAAQTPILKQFVQLLPVMADRFLQLQLDANTSDETEYKRLIAHLDDTFTLLRSAYNLEQVLLHQKLNLRRMALELAQFEKRTNLFLIEPVFPANDIPLDANSIFFAGSKKHAGILQQACTGLDMQLAGNKSADNYLNTRWQLLRESGIAIFDYSGYSPVLADPLGPIDIDNATEKRVLKAAGAIADIAYENGWAYVLGKPIITIMKKGVAMPFDMDIDPLVLDGKKDTVTPLMLAIQKALYGVSRATKANVLTATIQFAKNILGKSRDKKVQSILQNLSDEADATDIRLSVEAILDRMGGANKLLVTPAFAGAYPQTKQPVVFHVTAFRQWSKSTQTSLETICKKRGIEYRIGFDRLDPNILGSIFKDIGQSTFVVADITNLNPNAMLELAIAQALGKTTLIITQNKAPHPYCKAIQKTRTHFYDPIHAAGDLEELFNTFFKEASS